MSLVYCVRRLGDEFKVMVCDSNATATACIDTHTDVYDVTAVTLVTSTTPVLTVHYYASMAYEATANGQEVVTRQFTFEQEYGGASPSVTVPSGGVLGHSTVDDATALTDAEDQWAILYP